jgi:hypothetical protein
MYTSGSAAESAEVILLNSFQKGFTDVFIMSPRMSDNKAPCWAEAIKEYKSGLQILIKLLSDYKSERAK